LPLRSHARRAAWIAGGLALLAVLGIAILHTALVRSYVLRTAASALRDQGIEFEAARLGYNLLLPRIELEGVRVRSAAAPDLPALAEAERATIRLRWWPLLGGRIDVAAAEIQRPAIHLVFDEEGRDNIPVVPETEKEESEGDLDYLIRQFRLAGGSFRFEDRKLALDVTVPEWSVAIDGIGSPREHEIAFRTGEPVRIRFEGRELGVDEISADLLLRPRDVEAKRLAMRIGESSVEASGALHDFANPNVEATLNAVLQAAPLARFGGIGERVEGVVRIGAAVEGPFDALKVRARVNGDRLGFEQWRNLTLAAEANYDAAAQRVVLESLQLTSQFGVARASGNVALAPEAGQSDLSGSIGGIDLAQLSREFDLPVVVYSRGDFTLTAAWPALNFEQASGSAQIRLTGRGEIAKDRIPVGGVITASGGMQRLVVNIESVRAMTAELTGQATIERLEQLGGGLNVAVPDFGALLRALSQLEGDEAVKDLAPPGLDGSAGIAIALNGTVARPSAAMILNAGILRAGPVRDARLAARASADPTLVVIEEARLDWAGQALTARGSIGLEGESPELDLQAEIDEASIAEVLAALELSDVPANGIVSLRAQADGTVAAPVIEATVTARDLTAYQEAFGALDVRARLADNVARLEQLVLDKPDSGGLRITGSYDLKRENYTVTAESQDIVLHGLTLPGGTVVRGQVALNATGSGMVDAPDLTATLDVSRLLVNEIELGDLNTKLTLAGEAARVELQIPKFRLTAAASSAMEAPYTASVEVVADGTDLGALPVEAAGKLQGKVSARVTASGALEEWEKGELTARVDPLDIQWDNIAVLSEGPLVTQVARGMLTVDPWVVRAADSFLRLEGSMPLEEGAPDGTVRLVGEFSLPGLAALAETEEDELEVRGVAKLQAELRGNLKRIDPEATLELRDGYVKAAGVNAFEAIALLVAVKDGAVRLDELSAQFATSRIQAKGEVPLGVMLPEEVPVEMPRRDGPARLTLDMSRLDLSALEDMPRELSGAVSLRLDAEAPKLDLEEIEAKLTLPELNFHYENLRLAQKEPSTISVRKGMVRFDRFELEGPEAKLAVSGSAGLASPNLLDVQMEGDFNLAVLTSVVEGLRGQGPVRLRVDAGGSLKNPRLYGFLEATDAQLGLRDPNLAAEALNLRVELQTDRIEIVRLDGELNGGVLRGKGGIRIAGGNLVEPTLAMTAENVFLNFPEGVRTVSSTSVNLLERNDRFVLGGEVRILEGAYTEPLLLDPAFLRSLQTGADLEFTQERSPLLQRLDYDIAIRTVSPLIVDNNVAKAEIDLTLQLLGNYYSPGLNGRIMIEQGGLLILQERRYIIERGMVTFANERRIEPSLDILARTEASGFDVTLTVTGGAGEDLDTTLRADPPLPEPDIIALLLTGKTLEETRGSETDLVTDQALSLLAGNIGGRLSQQLQRATGLSQVRIEPNLIAQESDPTARLTLGQDLTRQLRLIYSMNLANSSDQIYIAEYDVMRRFQTRYLKQSDNSNRFEFRHDIRFGGSNHRRGPMDTRLERIVGEVRVTGSPFFPEEQLTRRLKARPGRAYNFFKVRQGLDKIENLYAKSDLLEVRLRLQRDERDRHVDLTLDVHPGPKVSFVFEGWDAPGGVRKRVRETWRDGFFDVQRVDETERVIRDELVRRGHYEASVDTAVTGDGETKRVLFEVEPGIRYERVTVEFSGAGETSAGDLERLVGEGPRLQEAFTRPARVTDVLAGYYREKGYLDVRVRTPRYEFDAGQRSAKVVFPVEEGPRYRVRRLGFSGNQVFDETQLREAITLREDGAYEPARRESSFEIIEDLYHRKGFNDVVVTPVVTRDERAGLVDVAFNIREGVQGVVQEVVVEGTERTSEGLVRGQMAIRAGEDLDLSRVSRSRRNLYGTGAYSLVDVERERLDSAIGLGPNQTPVRLRVRVQEIQPWELRYGAYFDTERGPGGIADIENRNMLGMARVLGFRTRYDADLREGRIYFSQPFLQRFPVRSIASSFMRREFQPAFITDRVGVSAQQEARFGQHYILNYGYRIERNHTFERDPDPLFPFDVTIRVAPLTSSLTRETRDDFLDASRGSFMAHSMEWATERLGSQLRYVRYFGQYFKYVPLGKPSELPWTGIPKSRLIYAGAFRIGLAKGLGGQDLIFSERFLAGGGTTVRGFEQNTLGPTDFLGTPVGGGGMLVVNNELRFPIVSIFDGVAFSDIGNIYQRPSDISLRDIRKSGGFGLRLRTPYFLLRLDYGFKLDRKPGESMGQFFFSIGQAF
jgi:outer membrane protein assembly complex protein YaeT